tara:strand:+ start:5920 stop:7068 length:1149 start_codon:yes stop_codon:yes gene_type:complete
MFYRASDIISCRALFFIIAFYIGLWTIRIPTIKDQLLTNYVGIGYIFASFAFGSILIMACSNYIIKKFSSKKVLLIAGIVQGILWLVVPYVSSLNFFIILAFIFGWYYGIHEVAMNLQASNIEKRENKSMMSGFHAFFSLGILLGSFFTSIMLELQLSFILNVSIYIAILLPLNIFFVSALKEDIDDDSEGKSNIFFFWPLLIFLLVILTIVDSLCEGGVDAWAALYMRDAIGVDGFQIGIATIFFNLFMVIGRLMGDLIRDKLGVYRFLISLISLSVIGLIIIFNYNSILSSVIGFSILGFGISSIVPLAYSLAGKVKGIDSAVGISIISIAAYGVFMIAPLFMGFIANYFGIKFVFTPMIGLFLLCLIIVIYFKNQFIKN